MTHDDVIKYLIPAIKSLWGFETVAKARMIALLLGHTEYHQYIYPNQGFPISEDYKRELEAIAQAGPNALFVLRIIRVKKGLHNDGQKITKDTIELSPY